MGPSIDDLIPPEPAALAPSVRRDDRNRFVLTVIADGSHQRFILTDDQIPSLLGDLVRIVLGENTP